MPYAIGCPWVREGWDFDALGKVFRRSRRLLLGLCVLQEINPEWFQKGTMSSHGKPGLISNTKSKSLCFGTAGQAFETTNKYDNQTQIHIYKYV